jgi:hypothetical protein
LPQGSALSGQRIGRIPGHVDFFSEWAVTNPRDSRLADQAVGKQVTPTET